MKQNLRKNKVVTGKNSVLCVRSIFHSPSDMVVLYGNDAF